MAALMFLLVYSCSASIIGAVPQQDITMGSRCVVMEKLRGLVHPEVLSLSFSLPHSSFMFALLCSWLQILTQEDWNVVLYNGMASTSPWASLYFVALMTFGNYVLFNLLVAILVEGFQAEVSCHQSFFHGEEKERC